MAVLLKRLNFKFLVKILFLFVNCFFTVNTQNIDLNDLVTVKTLVGRIQGYIERGKSYQGNDFISFYGIPYAKPPIDSLRFEPPENIAPFETTFKAFKPTQCLQINPRKKFHGSNKQIQGSEDCLHLNIHIPGNKIITNKLKRKPVLVHIHGGGFSFGSGHSAQPTFITDQDIILVTINYRVGIFGFLSSEDSDLPGNNALKDQNLALKWIQKNIDSFGGDPDNITLHGFSAGAASVHFHMFSPLSKGLFHRAISQSGVALNPWSIQDKPRDKFINLSQQLGCINNSFSSKTKINTKKMKNCLKEKSAEDILNAIHLFKSWYNNPFVQFAPVIDNWVKDTSDAFLMKHPFKMLQDKKIRNDVPWLVTMVHGEGLCLPGIDLIRDDYKLFMELDHKWDEVLGALLQHDDVTLPKARTLINKAVRVKYFGVDSVNQSDNDNGKNYTYKSFNIDDYQDIKTMIQLLGDRLFYSDFDIAIKLHTRASQSKVWVLNYNYTSENITTLHGLNQQFGIGHGDDVNLIFDLTQNNLERTENDMKITKFLLKSITNFIKIGNPDVDPWKSNSKTESIEYLNLQNVDDIQMKTVKELGNSMFWRRMLFFENKFYDMSKKQEELAKNIELSEQELDEEIETMKKEKKLAERNKNLNIKKVKDNTKTSTIASKFTDEF